MVLWWWLVLLMTQAAVSNFKYMITHLGHVKCPCTLTIAQRYFLLKQHVWATGGMSPEGHTSLIKWLLMLVAVFLEHFGKDNIWLYHLPLIKNMFEFLYAWLDYAGSPNSRRLYIALMLVLCDSLHLSHMLIWTFLCFCQCATCAI